MTETPPPVDDDLEDHPTLPGVLEDLDDADAELENARAAVRELVADDTPDPTPGRWIIRDDTLGQFVGGVVTKKPTKAALAALVKAHPGHTFTIIAVS
jgi:hypothetical protein